MTALLVDLRAEYDLKVNPYQNVFHLRYMYKIIWAFLSAAFTTWGKIAEGPGVVEGMRKGLTVDGNTNLERFYTMYHRKGEIERKYS